MVLKTLKTVYEVKYLYFYFKNTEEQLILLLKYVIPYSCKNNIISPQYVDNLQVKRIKKGVNSNKKLILCIYRKIFRTII